VAASSTTTLSANDALAVTGSGHPGQRRADRGDQLVYGYGAVAVAVGVGAPVRTGRAQRAVHRAEQLIAGYGAVPVAVADAGLRQGDRGRQQQAGQKEQGKYSLVTH